MKLEGRVAGPWAAELGRVWAETAPLLASRKLIIDLHNVTYADASGKQVLRAFIPKRMPRLLPALHGLNFSLRRSQLTKLKMWMGRLNVQAIRETTSSCRSQAQRSGEFFKKLSPAALKDLESLEFPTAYRARRDSFFREDECPRACSWCSRAK